MNMLVSPLMIYVLVVSSKRMPVFWPLEPSWKITSFSWRRSSKCHYSRSDLFYIKHFIFILNFFYQIELPISFSLEKIKQIMNKKKQYVVVICTSALSSPLQVASPDWASLYSASFVVSPRIINLMNTIDLFDCVVHTCNRITNDHFRHLTI